MAYIACIGSGNMGTALMKGVANIMGGESIGFTDADGGKAKSAAAALGAKVFSSNVEAVFAADFMFLAVKPQAMSALLDEIAPALKKKKPQAVLVSMAAGWTISAIQKRTCKSQSVVRIMPNTPALIGQGVIALASSSEVDERQTATVVKMLSKSGIVESMDEKFLDAVTALSGCAPAFVYMFIEALADGGVKAGLARDKALMFAAQTVLGAGAMVKETGRHTGELKDMVTSPAGATIVGVEVLEKGAFRGLVMSAVDAAFKRSKELSGQ
ncbi:MAG: pyrroline-5-carboxylate reductase [Treponema sp.]|nr:pyrroline-5-carboxylate reductase [Treponema sp.]